MADESRPVHVLMVCLGNICRSPMAEAVFRARVKEAGLDDRIVVSSAGTGRWHVGESPHPGTLREIGKHGLDLVGKTAQHVSDYDLPSVDYVVAMDTDNQRDLGGDALLLLDFADPPSGIRSVPDPYYGGGFGRVYELVDAGSRGLLAHIASDLGIDQRSRE
ncbi:MAG: low molecular weight protein-tyrosine-phosphatase [Anaerolineae bacterium]